MTTPKAAVPKKPTERVPFYLAGGALVLLAFGTFLFFHARSQVNTVALSSSARGVTVVTAKKAMYRPSRRYVGTLDPWVDAKVGPQFLSAYVDTVLVRPGATVKKGEVLATLDCRNAAATSKAMAEQSHALESMQAAIHHESERIAQLQEGGFVSPNEVEQKSAESASKQAQVLAMQAQMVGSSLQVSDCILRAPFDGDVADRVADPGAFVRPGTSIVTVVDRSIIRLVADVPEDDFASVPPGTPTRIHVTPTHQDLVAPITRRSPAADPATRTVRIEIDLADAAHRIPVYTTAEISLDVGEPIATTQLPLAAVSIRGSKASLFTVAGDTAHARTIAVKGEAGGNVFLDPSLAEGTRVVLQGRSLLSEGDAVTAMDDAMPSQTADASTPTPGSTP